MTLAFILTQISDRLMAIPFSGAGFQTMREAVPSLAQQAAVIAAGSLWQSAVIAIGLAVCLRLVPRTTAATRFAVWAAGFAAAFALPFLPLLPDFREALITYSSQTAGLPSGDFGPAIHPLLHIDWRWGLAIAALWGAASLYRVFDLVQHSFRLRKLWMSAVPAEISQVRLESLPLRRQVEICATRELQRPSVIGFFAPRILVPDWLLNKLTPSELDQIAAHETEHLRRGDDWTNLMQKLALIVFPLNPSLLWMERQLCREREMACDEAVIHRTQAPRAYAACLTRIAERGLQHQTEALSLGAWHKRPELARRVHSILLRRSTLHPLAARGLVAVVACGLLAGSFELARCPQLVAFTSDRTDRSLDNSDSAALAPGPPQLPIPVRMEGARNAIRYVPAIARIPEKANAFPHGSNRSELKAVLTPRPDIAGRPSREPIAAQKPGPQSVVEQIAMSHNEGARTGSFESLSQETQEHDQHFIVLTTWEEFESPAHPTEIVSEEAGNQAYDPAGAKRSGEGGDEVLGRVTITRLILRIVPTASTVKGTSSQAIRPASSGWLVFQL